MVEHFMVFKSQTMFLGIRHSHSCPVLCTAHRCLLNNLTSIVAVVCACLVNEWLIFVCHIEARRHTDTQSTVFKGYYWQKVLTWPHIILNHLNETCRIARKQHSIHIHVMSSNTLNYMHKMRFINKYYTDTSSKLNHYHDHITILLNGP